MSKSLLGLSLLGGASPLLMAATGVQLPHDAGVWLPWVLSVAGPALLFLAGTGVKAFAAGLRAKAKALRADKDEKNDWEADVLDAVADSADKAAQKKGLE